MLTVTDPIERGLRAWADWDLVIAADGINSRFREAYSDHFGVDVQERSNRFVWLGTRKTFDAFTFAFEKTNAGNIKELIELATLYNVNF